jgi:hypothetical protein
MNIRMTSKEDECKNIVLRATVLIGELLHLANTLLPPSQCANLQVRFHEKLKIQSVSH